MSYPIIFICNISENKTAYRVTFTVDWNNDADRKEEVLSIIADLLGFSWTGEL